MRYAIAALVVYGLFFLLAPLFDRIYTRHCMRRPKNNGKIKYAEVAPVSKESVFASVDPSSGRAFVGDLVSFAAVRSPSGNWSVKGPVPSADDLKDNFEPISEPAASKLLSEAKAALSSQWPIRIMYAFQTWRSRLNLKRMDVSQFKELYEWEIALFNQGLTSPSHVSEAIKETMKKLVLSFPDAYKLLVENYIISGSGNNLSLSSSYRYFLDSKCAERAKGARGQTAEKAVDKIIRILTREKSNGT